MGAKLIGGRTFRPGDEKASAIVVNETFVKQVMSGAPAAGRRLRFIRPDQESGPWMEITGVVRDLQGNIVDPTRDRPSIYRATSVTGSPGGFLFIRVPGGDPTMFIPWLREIAMAAGAKSGFAPRSALSLARR